jgi:ATP:ADP antiporter, AAA family
MVGHQTSRTPGLLLTATLCAAAVTGQFVAGKAMRDALFLTSLDVTALPAMLIATSACSMLLVALHSRCAQRMTPGTLIPISFVLSGVLFLVEWMVRPATPTATAIIVFLHISGAGPLLTSGFWLIASERFDPRTAKRRFGQLAGAGTLGGLLSALVAERVAALFGTPAMLPLLAVLQFASAALVRSLAVGTNARPEAVPAVSAAAAPVRSGLRVIAEAPYLRHLAALVLLGTTGAALVDYLFKVHAVETFGRGDQLLRFFAIYYAGTSILTFLIQTSSSRVMLERFGLGLSTSTPSFALLLGSIGGLLVPGFGSLVLARGGESIFRSSLFRAGYELFYTPIPADEKRAAKSLIDVAFDRLGDAVGGGLVRLTIVLLPAIQAPAILSLAFACSAGAVFAASRLNRGYISTLASSLKHHALGLDISASAIDAGLTRTLVQSLLARGTAGAGGAGRTRTAPAPQSVPKLDPEVQDILSLRSRDRERINEVLSREQGLPAVLVPHVIPLLAWDAVSEHATFALQKVAEEHVGEFVDALMDPNQDFAVRRRLARVFAVCVSQRGADGAMVALEDLRFGVRCQAARSLTAIVDKNPKIQIDAEKILEVVLREVAVGRPVWEGRRMLDGFSAQSPIDSFVRDRAGESLAHVFTLLSLVMPREPLQLAFRGLQTDDEHLRGTSLEYLDSVLPAPIRQRLWPFLEHRPSRQSVRPREEAIAALLRSHKSILLNLEELRRRTGDTSVAATV